MLQRISSFTLPWLLTIALAACGGKGQQTPLEDGGSNTDGGSSTDGGSDTDGGPTLGAVVGHLASTQGLDSQARARQFKHNLPNPGDPYANLSLAEVTVNLLRVVQGSDPESWPVDATAVPDATGEFAFEGLAEGDYALRVQQPEFAAVAYGVDTTEFHLGAGQTVTLVLPLITTVVHGFTDSVNNARVAPPRSGPGARRPPWTLQPGRSPSPRASGSPW